MALPANSDGFFDYQLDIKVSYVTLHNKRYMRCVYSTQTLEGSLQEEVKAEPLRFSFTTADQSIFMFQVMKYRPT